MTRNSARWEVAASAAAFVAGVGALGRAVTVIAARLGRRHQPEREDGWYVVRRAVTVDRPLDEAASAWRDPRLLSQVAGERIRLESLDGRRWTGLHDDGAAAWRADITMDNTDHVLRWRSTGGSVPHEGEVWFVPAPLGRGTEVRVVLRWSGSPAARIMDAAGGREPDQRMRDALRRFKSLLECGEVLEPGAGPSGVEPAAPGLRGPGEKLPAAERA